MILRHDTYLNISLLEDLTKMIHDENPFVQNFRALRKWVVNDLYLIPYNIVIHA